jgi:hypothetical protein
MSEPAPDALRRLEERLSQASEAAERLLADATRAARGDRPPASGWQAPDADDPANQRGEFELLLAGLGALRDLAPPEVLARLTAALRELLLALRALIDFYVERLERPRATRDEVRDIPID